MNAQSRRGFTLVELLVVIAIIGVLVALLLPAIQEAREAARRTSCSNNMKQLGIASQTHHDAIQVLPHNGYRWHYAPTASNGNPDVGDAQMGGWGYQLLPYLELQSVWEGAGAITPQDQNPTWCRRLQSIFSTGIPALSCPSRRGPTPRARPWGGYAEWPWDPASPTYAHTDYACVAATFEYNNQTRRGSDSLADVYNNWNPQGEPAIKENWQPAGHGWPSTGYTEGNGTVWSTRGGAGDQNYLIVRRTEKKTISLAELSDGTANTFLFAEKRLPIPCYSDVYNCPDDNEPYVVGLDWDNCRNSFLQPMRDPVRHNGDGGQDRFGSAHKAGFFMVMGDGAVKFAPYGINRLVFMRLARRNDGDRVVPPQ